VSIRTDPIRSESDHFGSRFLFDEAGVIFFDRFFQRGLVQWIKPGVPFKNVRFQVVPGAEPRFRYASGEMFTQVFQDARLLAHGSGTLPLRYWV